MLNTIDEFIATLDPIPSEVERNMRLITDLDRKSKEVMDKINELVSKYSESNSRNERKEFRLESNRLFKELDSLADDKLEVTLGVYDMIDMNIDRLIAVGRDHAEKKGQYLGYEMPRDENEPRFCYCKEVSCGNMIACDNMECPIEWFHMTCVQLEAAPKGKWYCRECFPKFQKKRSGSRRR